MMLQILGEEQASEKIEEGVKFVTANKLKSLGAGKTGYSTSEIGDLVAGKIAE
jgi:3-isopropylmalate dehydrogenase